LGNLFEDIKFLISLVSISVISGIISVTFIYFSGETSGGRFEFLFVFGKSSLLVFKGGFNFSEGNSVLSEFSFGSFSHFSNLNHEVIEINLSLDFIFNIVIKEYGEINL